ncbi:hypothetical protein LCGC14_1175680, partial [marine sediment metagenome]
LGTGQEIYTPRIKQIQVQTTEFGHCFSITWAFETIDICQAMTVSEMRLIDDLGILITQEKIPEIPCQSKDKLDLTIQFNFTNKT